MNLLCIGGGADGQWVRVPQYSRAGEHVVVPVVPPEPFEVRTRVIADTMDVSEMRLTYHEYERYFLHVEEASVAFLVPPGQSFATTMSHLLNNYKGPKK